MAEVIMSQIEQQVNVAHIRIGVWGGGLEILDEGLGLGAGGLRVGVWGLNLKVRVCAPFIPTFLFVPLLSVPLLLYQFMCAISTQNHSTTH